MNTAPTVLIAPGLLVLSALLGCGGKSAEAARPPPAAQAPASAPSAVTLREEAAARNPVGTERVRKTRLASDVEIVGSVTFHPNHHAVVGPLVPGRVARLRASPGDPVKAGQVLAEIESAEVGAAEAEYIGAAARSDAAEVNAKRERELSQQRISSARDREVAEAEATATRAQRRAAEERLRALGFRDSDIEALRKGLTTGGRLPLRTPIDGTVVTRSVTLGQAVERATDAFEIIELSRLWVNLDLYEKDLARVQPGQRVQVRTESFPEVLDARVEYIHPLIDPTTRTAAVRLEVDNSARKLRPGQFVTARILGEPALATLETLAVPRKAVLTIEGRPVVFVRTDGGFERRMVELGPSGGELVAVRQGLSEGEQVATDGAFLLKSELQR
ncbi:MAG TPA: efflux RND transporter periplasmic adaptor subunit [Myxococcaceae bacterium]|nr:efflux RND transporter periplasmic adaptor subunit [Myxococcaceae bacterium]